VIVRFREPHDVALTVCLRLSSLYDESSVPTNEGAGHATANTRVVLAIVSDEGGVVYQELSSGLH